jgi:hypothetical protein
VLIMTTHFMDEADILGDWITIMHNVRALPPLRSPSAFAGGWCCYVTTAVMIVCLIVLLVPL